MRRVPSARSAARVQVLRDRLNASVGKGARKVAPIVRAIEVAARGTSDQNTRGVAAWARGVLATLEGHPAPAARHFGLAAQAFERGGSPIEAADVLRAETHALKESGEWGAALRTARRAAAIYARERGVPKQKIAALAMSVGSIHHHRQDLDAARGAYAVARRALRAVDEPIRRATIDYNEANLLAFWDRTEEARVLLERALAAFRDASQGAWISHCRYALAGLDLVEGDLDAARRALTGVEARSIELGDGAGGAHCALDLAECLLRLNLPSEAERAAQRARAFFVKQGQVLEAANASAFAACADLARGRVSRALPRLRGVVKTHRDAGAPVSAALHGTALAATLLAAGQQAEAARIALAAARTLEARKLPSRAGRALALGAEALRREGKAGRAEPLARRALALGLRGHDLRVQQAALLVLARIEQARGRLDSAYAHLVRAERCVERQRPGVSAEDSRLAFALDKLEVYEALVTNRLERGGPAAVRQALMHAERGKARLLAECLSRAPAGEPADPATRQASARLARIERQLAVAESRLDDEKSRPGLRAARGQRVEKLLEARWRALEKLSREDPEQAAAAGAVPPDPWFGMAALSPREVALEYVEADGRLHLFRIERESIEAHAGLADAALVRQRLDALRFQLGRGVMAGAALVHADLAEATLRAHLADLHALLLAPVASHLAGRSVRVIPHGALHGLPFHALEDDGGALIDRCVVSYAPSLATLGLFARESPAPQGAPVILGVPDAAAPEMEAEVLAVQRCLGGARVLRGEAATREALEAAGTRPALLHVACHGFYSEGPMGGGLRLGDAWVSLADLHRLRNTAEIVVLSGCETGRGTVHSGDEWVGLVRGFLQAGARAVVASLWEVHDASTATLMRDFHVSLAAGFGVAEALALAQRRARAQQPNPLRWAPFMVVGDPQRRLAMRRAA